MSCKWKKNLILMFAFIIVIVSGLNTASAQFTITLPKIPKIKKPKIEQPTTVADNNQTVQTNTSEQKASTQTSDDGESLNPVFVFELEEIAKAQKQVDEYTPEDKLYLVDAVGAEWLSRAVSMRKREKWAKDRLKTPFEKQKFADALDALASSAAKKLPAYKGEFEDYGFHNAADEKKIKGVLTNPADYKIFAAGLDGNSWAIDKNDFGIPTARYKSGAIYLKDTTDDHPYCHLYYVNIIQDYSGGGTYGASNTLFVKDKLVGCPAGK